MAMVNVGTSLPTEPEEALRMSGGCGGGRHPLTGVFEATAADGERHCLRLAEGPDEGRLLLGERDWSTVFTLVVSDSGTVTLKTRGHGTLAIVDGVVRASTTAETAFILERGAGDHEFRVRTSDGRYFSASAAGAPIALTAQEHDRTTFTFTRTNQFGTMWAADEGDPFDERHSTHLWIFRRAEDWILSRHSLGSGPAFTSSYREDDRLALTWCLSDPAFERAVAQGLYDADQSGVLDAATSGYIFSAHFWNPKTGKGGTWDPANYDPFPGVINAFNYGVNYFDQSLQDGDIAFIGRRLGLAMHYLQDVTQPMHCANFRNFPESQSYQHENYEQWALSRQKEWTMTDGDLDRLDFAVLRGSREWSQYWYQAAQEALSQFEAWAGDSRSPIGNLAPTAWHADPPSFADQQWTAVAMHMVKRAQRLVTNLLLTWASLSVLGRRQQGAAPVGSQVLALPEIDTSVVRTGMVAGASRFAGERADVGYLHHCVGVGAREAWTLEPAGAVVGSNVVYYIKNAATGLCLVAPDRLDLSHTGDHNIYMQEPAGRLNAQWILIPTRTVVRAEDKSTSILGRFRDRKHGKFLGGSPKGQGPLRHLDQKEEGPSSALDWMPIIATTY
jgi:hypothetical protein